MSVEVLSGPLPEGWERKELGNIAETQLGKMLNSSKQTGLALKPYLRNINLQWGRIDLSDVKEMDIFDNEMKQFMLAKGDVLVCEGGEPGRSAVWNLDIEMGFQNAIHRIRPRERLSSEFACYQFEWLVKNGILDELFTGVTIKHFSQQKLRKVKFVVPSLNEQKKIVEILEEQLSRLDAALASVRTVREKSERFRRSLLHAAFTGALTGHDTSDGMLPPGWERKELDDIAETQLGKMLNSSRQTGLALKPYLRNINLRWGRVELSDIKEMDIFENETNQFMLAKGDVLVCEGGEPGRSAVWNLDIEMGFQNAIHRIRPGEKLKSEFVCYQFEWLVKNGILDEFFTGVTIKHFSQQKLRKVEFVVPSLNEQEKIVEILEEQLSRLDASLAMSDVIEAKAAALRRSLLHAAFTGDLTKEWREGAHV